MRSKMRNKLLKGLREILLKVTAILPPKYVAGGNCNSATTPKSVVLTIFELLVPDSKTTMLHLHKTILKFYLFVLLHETAAR
jgi:hypothetical protein